MECLKDGYVMKVLYADDVTLCSGLLEEVIDVYGKWSKVPEEKSLRFESGHKSN